jgi:hypothetical protein
MEPRDCGLKLSKNQSFLKLFSQVFYDNDEKLTNADQSSLYKRTEVRIVKPHLSSHLITALFKQHDMETTCVH